MSNNIKIGLLLGIVFLVLVTIFIPQKEKISTEKKNITHDKTIKQEKSASTTKTSTETVIGKSVEGRKIKSFTFGTGSTSILFVGGMHGGYEWNSILLAYDIIDALENKQIKVPDSVKVHIIPNLNPDGLFAATSLTGKFKADDIKSNKMHISGTGRFNANNVDLNRNFDCNWKQKSSWKNNLVSAGTKPFSEPESRTLRNYVNQTKPTAVVFWHSKANKVYASECKNGILPKTIKLMNVYADNASYGKVKKFTAYPITGDAEGWLASINIPAVTVELGSRTNPEFNKNIKGVQAVIDNFQE